VGQINGAINQISQAVQQNAAAAEELASTSEEVNAQALDLQSMMAFFTLARAVEQRARPLGEAASRTALKALPPGRGRVFERPEGSFTRF